MPTTHIRIIAAVIIFLGVNSLMGMGALCWCLITGRQIDQTLLTAFMGIEGTLVGYLGGILSNTRSQTEPTATSVTTDKNSAITVTPNSTKAK